MKWQTKFLFLVLLVAITFHVSKLVIDAGAFREISSKSYGLCRNIESPQGPEDIEYDRRNGLLFVSASPRPHDNGEIGGIYVLDIAAGSNSLKLVSEGLPFRFLPHGISVYSRNNIVRVFAINHAGLGSVEVFDWANGVLKHLKTIEDQSLLNIHNDLVADGPMSFYVTIEQGSKGKFLRAIETYSRLAFGKVLYYDGEKFSRAASGLHMANGILIHPDGRHLLVSQMLGLTISVYNILSPGALVKSHEIRLEMGPDNLSMAEDGALWVAGHPNLFKIKSHMEDHQKLAPTQVVRITSPLENPTQEIIFSDTGAKISGASTAVPVGGRFYLGSIFTAQFLECTLKAIAQSSSL